jgi:hypothetical protein
LGKPLLLAAAVLLLGAAWWCYSPGLSGGFLFDDFNNLDQLGAYGRVDNARTLALYLSSGSADPIGRPLSLLSFLVDARDWPADPGPFKRTNILLHLLNGILLGAVLWRTGRRLKVGELQRGAAAILGAALWTLHPLLVSTTLYVVQREAMLPALFTLLGMLAWMEGSERQLARKPGGLTLLIAGAWGCTAAATLCKANGALLPLLLLTLEWAAPPAPAGADAPASRRYRVTRALLLGPPSLLLLIWLGSHLPGVLAGETAGRPWTLGQRLLSEPRVLCDYLLHLWIPQASSASVFNDSFTASSGWLHPWTTLPAVAAILALLGLGVAMRRRSPALAFAIAFYFVGQLLESTVVPLELYFEHRNYLPALPMFWPLALWLTGPGSLKILRQALVVALPLLLALLCHARAVIWGRPYEQALLLAAVSADSPRAEANAAAYEMARGRPDLASQRLRIQAARNPEEVQLALNWVAADCAQGAASPAAYQAALYALAHNRGDSTLVYNWLVNAMTEAKQHACGGLGLPEIAAMVQVAVANPRLSASSSQQALVQQLKGRLSLAQGDGDQALREFNAGLAVFPTPGDALLQAAALGSAGYPAQGLEHLRYFRSLKKEERVSVHDMPSLHLWLLGRLGYWTSELEHMEQQLREDAAQDPRVSSGGTHP